MPSAISETEIIISEVDEQTKDLVTTQARSSCCSGSKIANVFRKKVLLQTNTCKLLKKSKANVKHQRFPFTMLQVLIY